MTLPDEARSISNLVWPSSTMVLTAGWSGEPEIARSSNSLKPEYKCVVGNNCGEPSPVRANVEHRYDGLYHTVDRDGNVSLLVDIAGQTPVNEARDKNHRFWAPHERDRHDSSTTPRSRPTARQPRDPATDPRTDSKSPNE